MAIPTGTPANAGNDIFNGGLLNDNFYGGAGEDLLYGGEGNDNLRGGTGSDSLFGGSGNDYLSGDEGADYMEGGEGNDVYVVDDAGDQVVEASGQGIDTVRTSISYALGANLENLELQGSAGLSGFGNAGDNALKGNSGDNALYGLTGKDSLAGGDGADVLVGGAGHDWLQGGAGADLFVLDGVGSTEAAGSVNTKQLNSTSSDAITDFVSGVDHIVVNLSDFAGINAGALDAEYFAVGVAATAAHAQFIYDTAHKALLWDADGTGAGKAVKVADISNGASMSAGDIWVRGPAAATLDFEDLDMSGGYAVLPTDYKGFSFTTANGGSMMYAVHGGDYGGGYGVMNTNAAYNPWAYQGIDLHATNGEDFIFSGADLVAAWDAVQEVTFHGFKDGVEIFTQTFNIDDQHITHADVGAWLIDDLKISVTSNGGGAWQTVFDNIGVTQEGLFPHP